MNFESVLIVTYGRTGSTLLMGVLNAIPGVLVRGENMSLCTGLFLAYKALRETKRREGKIAHDSTTPFYGADKLDESAFFSDARTLVKHQLVPIEEEEMVRCWGFKEIRYTEYALQSSGQTDLPRYLDFLAKLFPAPAFIFLTRAHDDVARSDFWKDNETLEALGRMKTFEREAQKWSENRNDSYWIDYSNIVARDSEFIALFHHLGTAYDSARIEKVLSREHSFNNKVKNLAGAERRALPETVAPPITKQHAAPIPTSRPTSWQVVTTPSKLVLKFLFDVLPNREPEEREFDVGGVVVLSPEAPEGLQLVLTAGDDNTPLQWGVASPHMEKAYPLAKNARCARWSGKGVLRNGTRRLAVTLIMDGGHKVLVGEAVLESSGA